MSAEHKKYRITVLPGDGIGPEVTDEALRVLRSASVCYGFDIEAPTYLIGGAALDAGKEVLPSETLEACRASEAVFLGAVGGPKWDTVSVDQRPERALLALRKALGVYANLRPIRVPKGLGSASPLKADLVDDVDLIVVRELTGGIYFGRDSTGDEVAAREGRAYSTMAYTRREVERVARSAFSLARRRRSHVTSVDKANVLAVSRLWREVVSELHKSEFSDIELDHMYVDNAAMQLVRRPRQFDVLLTGNLFGDILSDLAATLPGSLGMLPSASIGDGLGLFEPVHGSAPDIAGEGLANPSAAILSAAMLLEHVGETDAAAGIRAALNRVLESGLRTSDIHSPSTTLATTIEFGAAVAGEIAAVSGSRNGHSERTEHSIPS